MFRLINSHLQAYSLQVKSQDAVHTLGSQCVYISEMFKPYHMIRLHITLCNKNSCADVQINITIRIQALRDVVIQILQRNAYVSTTELSHIASAVNTNS
jgi:hypothetical protein